MLLNTLSSHSVFFMCLILSVFWLAGATLNKANPKSKQNGENIYEQPVHTQSLAVLEQGLWFPYRLSG